MPTYKTARNVAEDSLRKIGAFPASQSQADAGELRIALNWLEMIINHYSGIRPLVGHWKIVDIPLEANIGDYVLTDYTDASEVQHVFSVGLVKSGGDVEPLEVIYENEALLEDLTDTGTPGRVSITKDAIEPKLKAYPMPTSTNENNGEKFRLRIQTYQSAIDNTGVADSDLLLRPSWYLWLVTRTSYELGSGPVRRLAANELEMVKKDYEGMETALIARDGQYVSGKPPTTQPIEGWDY